MAATTSGALKATIESFGLGVAAYRDHAPADAPAKYVVIHEGISRRDVGHGDFGDANADQAIVEEVQVDLWEDLLAADRATVAESPTLRDDLHRRLHGCQIPTHPKRVHGCRVLNSTRMPPAPGDDSNKVRTIYNLALSRAI